MKTTRHARSLTAPRLRTPAHAIAVAAALSLSSAGAFAGIEATGYGTNNPNGLLIDDVNNNLGTAQAFFSDGNLRVTAGSELTLGSLNLAPDVRFTSLDNLIDGIGTRVNLIGPFNRLEVGNGGRGYLTVSGGAVVDARQLTSPAVDCGACFNVVGNAAGSNGQLIATGAGTFVNLWALQVGNATVVPNFGVPGAVGRGYVEVLDGARLHSVVTTIGNGPSGSAALGNERTFAEGAVRGANSVWRITGNLVGSVDASLALATHANATAEFSVTDGGSLQFDAVAGRVSQLLIGRLGKADAFVAGSGANITFAEGATSLLQIGHAAGGVGSLSVLLGGQVTGVWYSSVGRGGGTGRLTVDGADSVYRLNGSTAAIPRNNITAGVAVLDVGRDGGNGTLNVTNGGKLQIESTTSRLDSSPGFRVGRDATSVGTANVSGAGSRIEVTAASVVAGGGPGEARNPVVTIGQLGTGVLNVTAGGKVLLQGNAVSTVADSRSTVFNIGGNADTASGGLGSVKVSGAGSEIAITGSDAFLSVGRGAGATGQLTIENQGLVRSTNINVGRSGAVGVVLMNNGRIELSGQQTGNTLAGAFMSVGLGGGSGVMTMSNGSVVSINNASGTSPTGFQLGGSATFPLGTGVLTMTGGSRIEITGPENLGVFQVGRDGVGTAQLSGSQIDVGPTGLVQVGRAAGGSGILRLADSSTVTAGFVGVGRYQLADLTNADGGIGLLNVTSGSVVNATNVVIGSKGVLSGSGTINGNVVNFGVISPGDSPGTLIINGNFSNPGGKIVLEIESDGLGGFNTDKIIFGKDAVVDLGGLAIDFQFLADTDPNAFLATGNFDIDTFIARETGSGGTIALDDSAYAGKVTFSAFTADGALAGFSIDPTGTVTAVPEPQTYALFGLGLAVLGWARRRQMLRAAAV